MVDKAFEASLIFMMCGFDMLIRFIVCSLTKQTHPPLKGLAWKVSLGRGRRRMVRECLLVARGLTFSDSFSLTLPKVF
jgi:hypothetical protein